MQGGDVGTRHRADEPDPVGDAVLGGGRAQGPHVRVGVELAPVAAARDDELGVRHLRQGLDQRVHALALHEPADREDAALRPVDGEDARRGPGPEGLEVDPARRDVQALGQRAEREQLAHLVRAGRDDGVRRAREVLLAAGAPGRAGVGGRPGAAA